MARDRQRAKQRRAARQSGTGARAAGSRRPRETRERETGLGEGRVEDAGLGEPTAARDDLAASGDDLGGPPAEAPTRDEDFGGATPAPDPLEHASADVDEALLAETGAPVPSVNERDLDDDEVAGERDAAPDAVEGDLVRSGSAAAARADRPSRGRALTFLGHSVDELRRVQWPDRRHVGQGTAVVMGFVVVAGGYLGLLDAIWKPLIQAIL